MRAMSRCPQPLFTRISYWMVESGNCMGLNGRSGKELVSKNDVRLKYELGDHLR